MDDPASRTATFYVNTHLEFFNDIFQLYGLSFPKGALSKLFNNCSTNRHALKLTGKPLLEFHSHKLDFEIRRLISSTPGLQSTIFALESVMLDAERKLRNVSLACNFTDLKPILWNLTWWSGSCTLTNRSNCIPEKLIRVNNEEKGELPIDLMKTFKKNCEKYASASNEFNVSFKSLQKRCNTLAVCLDSFEVILDTVSGMKDDRKKVFYCCRIERTLISGASRHPKWLSSPLFWNKMNYSGKSCLYHQQSIRPYHVVQGPHYKIWTNMRRNICNVPRDKIWIRVILKPRP